MKTHRVVSRLSLGLIFVGSLSLAACGGGGEEEIIVETGTYNHFVTDTVTVPTTSAQAQQYGLDIDGDPNHRVDNALGGILASLSALPGGGFDIQMSVDEAINMGTLVILHSIRTDDATLTSDGSVSWNVYFGEVMPVTDPPNFNGTGNFAIQAGSPTNAMVTGKLIGGSFKGGPSNVSIQLTLVGSEPIRLNMIGARIEGLVSAGPPARCTEVKLGGAVTQDDLNTTLLPTIADLLTQQYSDVDCDLGLCAGTGTKPTCCTIDSQFDTTDDNTITVAELTAHPAVSAILTPDVDLLDADGNFNPNDDGEPDSLSLGLKFSCVSGNFTAATETP